MEAYCVFLIGNFIALPAFEEDYGVYSPEADRRVIEASWQSALQAVGPIGALIGVVLSGPLTSRIGYRWAIITALMFLNAFIFVFYFAKSLPSKSKKRLSKTSRKLPKHSPDSPLASIWSQNADKHCEVMFLAQILEGIPWGVFIANAPAYCSEIVPIPLRAPATQMLQMFWAIGAIIVGGVTYYYNDLDSDLAYRYESLRFRFVSCLGNITDG
jgi:SP family general alpha glucoside:H+ symporter-like MFS transporter